MYVVYSNCLYLMLIFCLLTIKIFSPLKKYACRKMCDIFGLHVNVISFLLIVSLLHFD